MVEVSSEVFANVEPG